MADQPDITLRDHLLVFSLLIALIAVVYGQSLQFEFINFDDDVHVYENDQVRTGLTAENVIWAFGIHGPSQWHPLAWISHQLDCSIYGLNPLGHHLTNLLLHGLASYLLFLALSGLTKDFWPSFLVAALFAVHPLNVESVVWISERRNVLGGVFWMLTMLSYLCYVKRGGILRYGLLVLLFGLGLMSKPMLVTLPCVLFLLDLWPLKRWRGISLAGSSKSDDHEKSEKETLSDTNSSSAQEIQQRSLPFLAAEKAPLLVLSAISSILTIMCQQSDAIVVGLSNLPLESRLSNSVYCYAAYLGKLVWPTNLAVFYPHPAMIGRPIPSIGWALLVLVSITTLVLLSVKKRPYLAVGWFWYLGTLVPMIGLIQVGYQQMADRYLYIPAIGIFIAIGWGFHEYGPRARKLLQRSSPLMVLALAAVAFWQYGYWKNSMTLFQRTADVTQANHWAHNNLGLAYYEEQKLLEAITHYQQAIDYVPDYALAYYNLGVALYELGRKDEARACFDKTVEMEPANIASHSRLGALLAEQGNLESALFHFREVVRLQPEHVQAKYNLALALARQGELHESIQHLRQALKLSPDNSQITHTLSLVMEDLSRQQEEMKASPKIDTTPLEP